MRDNKVIITDYETEGTNIFSICLNGIHGSFGVAKCKRKRIGVGPS